MATQSSFDVFISYRWVEPDLIWVREHLYPSLIAAGIKPLLDVEDFVPGRDVLLEMERAGSSVNHVLCILSPDYFEGRRMVDFESLSARRRDPEGDLSSLIPLLLRPAKIPERIRGLVPLDWTEDRHLLREWSKLLRLLNAPNKDVPPPPACLPKNMSKNSPVIDVVSNVISMTGSHSGKTTSHPVSDSRSGTVRFHPVCHLANGERLYFFFIRSTGNCDACMNLLAAVLEEAGLKESSYAYLLFGEFDFIIRVWAHESACRVFEEKLGKYRQSREVINEWRKIIVSRMSTWLQRDYDTRSDLKTRRFDQNVLEKLWCGNVEPALQRDLRDTGESYDKLVKFFMLIEEPFDAEQKVFNLLHKLLPQLGDSNINESEYGFLKTWSLYSIYFYPETNHGVQKRGVLLSGAVESLATSSRQLVTLSGRLSELARVASGANQSENAAEFIFKTVTYICSETIKEFGGRLIQQNHQHKHERVEGIVENLLLSHDNHSYSYTLGTRRNKVQQSFIKAACQIPIDRFFRGFFIQAKDQSDWWGIISEIRFVYKYLVFNRNDQAIQMLFKKYVSVESALRDRLSPLVSRDASLLEREALEMIKGKPVEVIANIIVHKDLPKAVKKITMDPMAALVKDVAKSAVSRQILTQEEGDFLKAFSEDLRKLAEDRNHIFHGSWRNLTEIQSDDTYGWVPIVKNYIKVSLTLSETLLLLEKIPQM